MNTWRLLSSVCRYSYCRTMWRLSKERMWISPGIWPSLLLLNKGPTKSSFLSRSRFNSSVRSLPRSYPIADLRSANCAIKSGGIFSSRMPCAINSALMRALWAPRSLTITPKGRSLQTTKINIEVRRSTPKCWATPAIFVTCVLSFYCPVYPYIIFLVTNYRRNFCTI